MSVVALKRGNDRRATVRAALELVRDEVAPKIASPTLLKPNFLSSTNQLASTHPDAIRGTLDFLLDLPNAPSEIVIAEGGNERVSGEAYRNFGYDRLPDEYDVPIRLVDLHQETEWDETEIELADGGTWRVGVPKTVLACPTTISVAVAKTHDVLYATLALKNMIMGSIRQNDRVKMHGYMTHRERVVGRESQILNRNLIRLAAKLTPDVAVIDGIEGLQGNGPGGTDVVPLESAFAGVDVWAVDAACMKAMGFDPLDLGVCVYAKERRLGETDVSSIEIRGDRIEDVARVFTPHERYPHQRQWREPGVRF
jgi:uncharacterized protein (DUF362 family)